MIEPYLVHDPKASEVMLEILSFPCQDDASGGTIEMKDAYSSKDLSGLIMGNLNRHHMLLIRTETVEALIANAVKDAVDRVISQEDTGHGRA